MDCGTRPEGVWHDGGYGLVVPWHRGDPRGVWLPPDVDRTVIRAADSWPLSVTAGFGMFSERFTTRLRESTVALESWGASIGDCVRPFVVDMPGQPERVDR